MANIDLILTFTVFSVFSFSTAAVIQLDAENFDSFIRSHQVVLVDFFAPWCGHCIKMAPAYEEASARLQRIAPDVSLTKLDCAGSGKMVCQRLGVDAFPTLLLFRNGMRTDGEYEGERNPESLVNYMLSKRGPGSLLLREAQNNQAVRPVLPMRPIHAIQTAQPNLPSQAIKPQVMSPNVPRPSPNLPNAVNLLDPKNAAVQKPAIKPSTYPAVLQRLTPDVVSQIIGLINAGKIHAKHHIPKNPDIEYKVTPELANKVLAMISSGELLTKNTIPKSGGDDKKTSPKAGKNEVEASIDFTKQLQNMINNARKSSAKGKKEKGKKLGIKISIGKKGLKVEKSSKN